MGDPFSIFLSYIIIFFFFRVALLPPFFSAVFSISLCVLLFQETSRRVENQVIKQFPIFAHPSRLDLISSKKPEK